MLKIKNVLQRVVFNPIMGLLLIGFSTSWSEVTNNTVHQTVSMALPNSAYNQLIKPDGNKLTATKQGALKANIERFLVELPDRRQKEIVSDLFSRNGILKSGEKTLEKYSLQDLNILSGSGSRESNGLNQISLYQAIDRTETAAGSVVLSALLSNPISDLSVIKGRQRLISFLLENEEIYNHLVDLVKVVKEGENSLLNCWNEEATLDENVKSLLYSSKGSVLSFLNKSSASHQLHKILLFGMAGVARVAMPCALLAFIFYSAMVVAGPLMSDLTVSLVGAMGMLHAVVGFVSSKAIFNYVRLLHRTIFSIHQRLRHISQLTQAFDELFYNIQNHKELSQGLSLVSNMSDFVLDPKALSNDLYHLKDFLNRSIFDQERFGVFSHAGNVIAAYSYMQDAQDPYIAPLEAVGEIDAYLSVVKLIKEYRTKAHGFCMVDFIEQQESSMNLQGAWNVLIGVDRAKSVTIALGGIDNPPHVILSGPTNSGKSTLIHTIASCDILGRTFGIAPAKKATMTMFGAVRTYMHTHSSSSEGRERAKGTEVVNYIKKNPNKKILVIVDEPYKSMIDESAEVLTYDFVAEMAHYPNVLCIATTKYKKLTDLADETGNFANYHLEVSEDIPNYFERTFALAVGKCEWWYIDAAKRNRYFKFFN